MSSSNYFKESSLRNNFTGFGKSPTAAAAPEVAAERGDAAAGVAPGTGSGEPGLAPRGAAAAAGSSTQPCCPKKIKKATANEQRERKITKDIRSDDKTNLKAVNGRM